MSRIGLDRDNMLVMADKFEDTIHKGLHQYLVGIGKVDVSTKSGQL